MTPGVVMTMRINVYFLLILFQFKSIITFFSNSKSSLLKLLCTLTCLFEGHPLQPLRLDFSGINLPSYPCSQLTLITFHGSGGTTTAFTTSPFDVITWISFPNIFEWTNNNNDPYLKRGGCASNPRPGAAKVGGGFGDFVNYTIIMTAATNT